MNKASNIAQENMYQAKIIINKYNDNRNKFQIIIPPHKGIKSSMENPKRIMIGKSKKYGISKIKPEKRQRINILQDSVKVFKKMSERVQRQWYNF